jgi:hypothetical protein
VIKEKKKKSKKKKGSNKKTQKEIKQKFDASFADSRY